MHVFFKVPSVSPSEKGGIRIIKSNYGRLDKNICTNTPSDITYCTSDEFSTKLKEMCVYVNDHKLLISK